MKWDESIVIDAGHGGFAPAGRSSPLGARGPAGTLEKQVTLALALRIRERLGSRAILTRQTDRNLTLVERAGLVLRAGARAFVSLHAGGTQGGALCFVHPRASFGSRALGRAIQGHLPSTSCCANCSSNAIRDAELGLLAPELYPEGTAACLLEVERLNAAGERRLRDPRELDTIAASIARGLERWSDAKGEPDADAPEPTDSQRSYSRQSVYNPGDTAWSLVAGPTPNTWHSAGCLRRGTTYDDYAGWRLSDVYRVAIEVPARRFSVDLVMGWEFGGELPSLVGVGYVKGASAHLETRHEGSGGVSIGVLALAKWDSHFDRAKVQFDVSVSVSERNGQRPIPPTHRAIHVYGDGMYTVDEKRERP